MNLINYNHRIIENECIDLAKKLASQIPALFQKKIFITGANGLIGSFLCDFFAHLNENFKADIKIVASSYSEPENANRIKHLIERDDFKYFSWDCSKYLNSLQKKLMDCDIDVAIFCSGYGQPGKFLKDKTKTSLINTIGPFSILEHLQNQERKSKFLFLSSSEIYGSPPEDQVPTSENYSGDFDLNNPRECYKQSKKLGEVITSCYNGKKIDVKIARVALTYGPGALIGDKRVLQEFIFKAMFDREIRMMDEGLSKRNYLYLTDAAMIILNLILNSKCRKMVYNVGNDEETVTVFDVAEKIGNILDAPVKKGKRSLGSAPKLVYLSMNRYKNDINTKNLSLTPFDEGIEKTIRWFQDE